MKRYSSIIGLREEAKADYKLLHAAVWPSVLARLKRSNISNYSIFLREPENLLLSYFEYDGDNFEADLAAIESDPEVQKWWNICGPMQTPLQTRASGDWWASAEELFHLD